MTVHAHEIIGYVRHAIPSLESPAWRDMGPDAGCFSADRDGKRLALTVFQGLLPWTVLQYVGLPVPAEWTSAAVAEYIVGALKR